MTIYGTLILIVYRSTLSILRSVENAINMILRPCGRRSRIASVVIRGIKNVLANNEIYPAVVLNRASKSLICSLPFNEMVINCDGSVVCGTKSLAPEVGDITGDSFWDIWNGEILKRKRGHILQGLTYECNECVLYREGCYFTRQKDNKVIMDRGPRTLFIEPTVDCFMDCLAPCGRGYPYSASCSSRRRMRSMPLDLYKKIIDESGGCVDRLCLCNYGEPLLHPEIVQMIQYAKKKYPHVYALTSTNGMLLRNERLLRNVVSSGLDEIIFSVDGAWQTSYEKYRKGGDLKTILDAMREVILLRKEGKPKVIWRYILFAWNDSDQELEEARRLALDIGVDQFCYDSSYIPFTGSRRFQSGREEFEKIAPFHYHSDKSIFEYEMSCHELKDNRIRLIIRNVGNIRWNSVERPWGRYVCVQVYRKHKDRKPKEEVVFTEKIERDIIPGEEYTKEYEIRRDWFLRECNHVIYIDCILSDGLKFRDDERNVPLVLHRCGGLQ